MVYDPPVFERIGFSFIRKTPPEVYNVMRFVDDGGDRELTDNDKDRFKAFFGICPEGCSMIWDMLQPNETMPKGVKPEHLLWGLLFMKVYATETALVSMVNAPDEKTFRKWSQRFVVDISWLESEVVSNGSQQKVLFNSIFANACFLHLLHLSIRHLLLMQILLENRYDNDSMNDCLLSVDGTDCPIQQFKPWSKIWYSKKINGPGLRYEVGVCILSGSICWIHGPIPCGKWNDLQVFKHALINFLDDGERVESDKGYRGVPRSARIPDATDSNEVAAMRRRVGQRHETINRRLKMFRALKQRWRHSLELHSATFRAAAVITQLCFELGEPPFDVVWDDTLV